jgi:Ca2+-binding RTX toxin-like protein
VDGTAPGTFTPTGQGANEVLPGGQGRDRLIGGTGAAALHAGTGDDILIGC